MSSSLTHLQEKYKEAKALYDSSKFDESNRLLDRFYKEAVNANDKKFIGQVLSLMGLNHFSLGNYDHTLRLWLDAEKIFKEAKLMEMLPEAEGNLAVIYRRLDLFGHSLLKHQEALTYAFQTNEEYVITSCLLNSAAVLYETGYTDKAFRTLDAALLFCDKNKGDATYEHVRLVVLNNKATFNAQLKRYEEMVQLLHQAKALAQKYSFVQMFDTIDSNLVTGLTSLKRYDEAYRLLKNVLHKRKGIQDDQQVADLTKMGIIYKEYFRNPDEFLEYTGKALKLAEKRNLISRQVLINTLLRDYYRGVGNSTLEQNFEIRLKTLEGLENRNKQTGGMEKLFDSNVLAVENMLMKKKRSQEFFARYDYLLGNYSYTHRGVTRHVPLRDIAFCEVRGNYLYIYTFAKDATGHLDLTESHRLRKTMKDFVAEISSSKMFFARIHNSFIVNLYWLPQNTTGSGNALLIGDKELPMSDTYRPAFKKKLNTFLEQEMTV